MFTATLDRRYQVTHIEYDYDPLYRLTKAEYSGDISAGYTYIYDAAGNMTAYIETVNGQTASVSRAFNAANQLQTSTDASGTTEYVYDANGNLTGIHLPDVITWLLYDYNQRNLLIQHRTMVLGTGVDILAQYVYDGDGNRLQQIDHSNNPAITTTYTNDIIGLSQVLVSNDGTTTTYNLFGLDLISQDDSTETRFMLADGLGSVRVEMVGSVVETTITYEPYGKLLAQTGSSGTTYGFTGEQHDATTGLVYLRARYYSPYLNQFHSRDPFPGYVNAPASQNGYLYAYNNPINLADPTGLDAWWCDRYYPDVPSYAYSEVVANCQASNNRQFPPLLGSDAPYLLYKSYTGFVGTLTLFNGPHGTKSWFNVTSGALPGQRNAPDYLRGEGSNRGVPYISGEGHFSRIEGQRYPGGTFCHKGSCYRYPAGTFPVNWQALKLRPYQYNNSIRKSVEWLPRFASWDEGTWGPYRIPLDSSYPSPSLASGLFIHGGRTGFPTLGCIRISNWEVEELIGLLNQLHGFCTIKTDTPNG